MIEIEFSLNIYRIARIDAAIFENVPNLSELILDDNQLTNTGVSQRAFEGVRQLSRLSLMENQFTEFPGFLPGSLRQLYLSQNQISFVSAASLQFLPAVEILYLDRNKLSDGSFELGALNTLGNLDELELGYNFLTLIPSGINRALRRLHLTANQLVYLRTSQLNHFERLHTLDLAFNRIQSVEREAMQSLTSLVRIDLAGNNWNCDCYLRPLKRFLASNAAQHLALEHVLCGDEEHLGMNLNRIAAQSLSCPKVDFSLAKTAKGHGNGASVSVTLDATTENPPFVQFKLQYSSTGNF